MSGVVSHSPEDVYQQRALEAFFREELVLRARTILDGEGDPIEACRRITAIVGQLGREHDEVFVTFCSVASETDDVPTGDARTLWEPNALKEVEASARAYLAVMSKDLRASCLAIVREFGAEPDA